MITKQKLIGRFENTDKVLLIQVSFLGILALVYIFNGVFPSIEFLLALCIIALIWKAQFRTLLFSLMPFFILLLTYQSLRNFADNLTTAQIHVTDLINTEKFLFNGVIPAWFLQSKILPSPYASWISLLTNLFYMSHFVIPVIIAIILWYKKHELYWHFVVGILVLSYLGFITYVIFPAAPPWWATKYGYLPDQPVTLAPYFHPELAEVEGPNPVAAMPSLHMAYPSFISIFVYYAFGRKIKWIFLLPLSVGFSAVYLGHHYVIDLIAGIIYALTIFFIFQLICLIQKGFIESS